MSMGQLLLEDTQQTAAAGLAAPPAAACALVCPLPARSPLSERLAPLLLKEAAEEAAAATA